MIDPRDLEHCRDVIRTGSLSFHAASKLLPASVRDPALALYAFCRLADDEVDEGDNKARAVIDLQERLELVYAGTPRNAPEDRAFAAVVADFDMPRALPEALLEGLAWDAVEKQYDSLADLRGYCARVASAVGAMMCVLMRVRDADALARACDLGVAMQLTNIARDVGEDARMGRIYLPLDWLTDAGVDQDAFLADPQATPEIKRMVKSMLADARTLYLKSEAGIAALPLRARTGIFAARYIYAAIGTAVARNGYDSVNHRGRSGKARKIVLIGTSAMRAGGSVILPKSPILFAHPLDEVRFLVDAVATNRPRAEDWGTGRAGSFLSVMAELKARELGVTDSAGVVAE
ncbi:MAG: 15-cis-phytoene synthase [Tateyamaria sp.]|jgi:phytoene synthase|uniref:15-cis-phytoene synthase n=1 Tax=unclassified Tateyamaria TaxID=2645127 RepID=UPI000D561651|nr:phytoene/squalene synthase family protein [Tateyamaria sp. Alg231-49]